MKIQIRCDDQHLRNVLLAALAESGNSVKTVKEKINTATGLSYLSNPYEYFIELSLKLEDRVVREQDDIKVVPWKDVVFKKP